MQARGALSPELRKLRDDLAAMQSEATPVAVGGKKPPVERARPATMTTGTGGN
jgi:hypothetical protein